MACVRVTSRFFSGVAGTACSGSERLGGETGMAGNGTGSMCGPAVVHGSSGCGCVEGVEAEIVGDSLGPPTESGMMGGDTQDKVDTWKLSGAGDPEMDWAGQAGGLRILRPKILNTVDLMAENVICLRWPENYTVIMSLNVSTYEL